MMAGAVPVSQRRLMRTVYRGCLSAARRLERAQESCTATAPLHVADAGAASVSESMPSARALLHDATSLVRKAFRVPLCDTVPLQRRIDAGFAAMRVVSDSRMVAQDWGNLTDVVRLAPWRCMLFDFLTARPHCPPTVRRRRLAPMQLNARSAAVGSETYAPKPAGVAYRVGQVFRHRLYGWRAVIIGYDPCCRASDEWVRAACCDSGSRTVPGQPVAGTRRG